MACPLGVRFFCLPLGRHATHRDASKHSLPAKTSKAKARWNLPSRCITICIHDCSGNVHEIVRVSFKGQFPQGYRLAGGCFRTAVGRSSCRIFRRFQPQLDDLRMNVGLRLVRYSRDLSAARERALREYLSKARNTPR